MRTSEVDRKLLRTNSVLRTKLGKDAYGYLREAIGAFERLLPHTKVTAWTELSTGAKAARWASEDRREIRLCIDLSQTMKRSLHASISRRRAEGIGDVARTLDNRELDLCRRIASTVAITLSKVDIRESPAVLRALAARFDEEIVAEHLNDELGFSLRLGGLFDGLRSIAEQTYENRSIAIGCIVDSGSHSSDPPLFPAALQASKKYKALTDGFRTAYLLSSGGSLLRLVDLATFDRRKHGSDRDFYPEWAGDMARLSRAGRCGVCLTRAGDILVFTDGSLRFVYRFGRWRYLNHGHIVDLLKNLARAQAVPVGRLGAVAKSVYRVALDVSFRRSGGLLVLLRAQNRLRTLVQRGDAASDGDRGVEFLGLDRALGMPGTKIDELSRRVLVELASLDGALVIARSGKLLAYAAILRTQRKGRSGGAEGSRTKAAIGSSFEGLAVKISADGDIVAYRDGVPVLTV